MTEDQAQSWIAQYFGEEVLARSGRFVEMVVAESEQQNLVSATSLNAIWSRHVVDSLQLVRLTDAGGLWLDIGTGGGFPGMIVASARNSATVMVEPRRKRADFLTCAVNALGLASTAQVRQQRVEKVTVRAQVISGRAVASIESLFEMAYHCSEAATRWLLPRGTIGTEEMDDLRRRWSFVFHVEHSVVDGRPSIAVFDQVRRL